MTWTFKDYRILSTENKMIAKVASNSLVINNGDAIEMTSGFVTKAAPGDTIEGISLQIQTYDSDNQTVAQQEVLYRRFDKNDEYTVPVVGQILTLTGSFVASNTINLKVNGVAMTEVTYATSSAATFADLATQIATDFSTVIASATVVGATIQIVPVGLNDTVEITDIVIAAGVSQPTLVWTVSALADADVASFYDLTAAQFVNIFTKSASSGQVRLEDNEKLTFTVANT